MFRTGHVEIAAAHSIRKRLRALVGLLLRAKHAEPLEFEQILTRFAIYLIITIYLSWSFSYEGLSGHSAAIILAMVVCAWGLGIFFLVHLVIWPDRHLLRRALSISTDAAALSLLIGFGEESAAIFFPVYLWVTLGNGFRYGVAYLYGAIAVNLVGFVIMACLTPYWRESWQFSAGLAFAIFLIPLYVAKLIRNLHEAMNEAEAASRAKTEFLSMISHELRTPLTAILGLAHVSKVTAASERERFSAISTELAAGRLLRMVDTILKFQRIDSGAIERNDEAFDLLEILNEVEAIIEPLAQQKGLNFRIRFTSGIPDRLFTDPDHVQTIILNLVTNAVKYTRHGLISIEVGILEKPDSEKLRIAVRDTGIGIAAEAQPHIFDQFVRAQDHNVTSEAGVGLGLATCKSLTEVLGGKIGFNSTPGKGSLFWTELPFSLPEAIDERNQNQEISIPIFVIEEAGLDKLAEQLDARRITFDEALSLTKDIEGGRPSVLALTPDALTYSLSEALTKAMSVKGSSLALVLIRQNSAPSEGLDLLAAGVSKTNAEDEAAALVKTVARWHWRTLKSFEEDSLKVTALTRSLSVLVADDNELNCQVLRRMLELNGHKVILANTGDEALQYLLDGVAEIALLDVNMPGMSGIDVCRAYRTGLGSGAFVPVVALTADISGKTRKECLGAGMSDVLGKPVTPEQLSNIFNKYVLSVGVENREMAPKQEKSPEDASSFDEKRIVFLRELFGDEGVQKTFLPSFKRDLLSSLKLLRQAVNQRRPPLVYEALHAIKSSATTAGAREILDEVQSFRDEATVSDFAGFEARLLAAHERYQESVCRQALDQAADKRISLVASSS